MDDTIAVKILDALQRIADALEGSYEVARSQLAASVMADPPAQGMPQGPDVDDDVPWPVPVVPIAPPVVAQAPVFGQPQPTFRQRVAQAQAVPPPAQAPGQQVAMPQWVCPIHGAPPRMVPAGVSAKTGKAYNAFYVCSVTGCEQRPPR